MVAGAVRRSGASLRIRVALRASKLEDMAVRSELLDEIGDTLFAVAMAGAIGLCAANLAIQLNKERAAFDASAASQKEK